MVYNEPLQLENEYPVHTYLYYATILDFCGMDIPEFAQGTTLRPHLENKQDIVRGMVFCG